MEAWPSTQSSLHNWMSLNKTIKKFPADVKVDVLEHYRKHDENGIPYERYVQASEEVIGRKT